MKPKISEEGASAGGDAEDAPLVSIGSIEDSAAEEPVSGSPHEKAEDSEHAGGVTEAPSNVVGDENVSPETSFIENWHIFRSKLHRCVNILTIFGWC